jgi:hypothetical protein
LKERTFLIFVFLFGSILKTDELIAPNFRSKGQKKVVLLHLGLMDVLLCQCHESFFIADAAAK